MPAYSSRAPGSKLRAMDPAHVLTPDAVEFLTGLERRFGPRRRELLAAR